MKDTTLLKWLYIFEVTAPVFYRTKAKFIKDPAEKKLFHHFEESEIPHAPQIKDFLREKFDMGVFPAPGLIEVGAAVSSFLIALMGKKAIYYFEYLFEREALSSYTTLQRTASIPEMKDFAKRLYDEEVPHYEYFKGKLEKNS